MVKLGKNMKGKAGAAAKGGKGGMSAEDQLLRDRLAAMERHNALDARLVATARALLHRAVAKLDAKLSAQDDVRALAVSAAELDERAAAAASQLPQGGAAGKERAGVSEGAARRRGTKKAQGLGARSKAKQRTAKGV